MLKQWKFRSNDLLRPEEPITPFVLFIEVLKESYAHLGDNTRWPNHTFTSYASLNRQNCGFVTQLSLNLLRFVDYMLLCSRLVPVGLGLWILTIRTGRAFTFMTLGTILLAITRGRIDEYPYDRIPFITRSHNTSSTVVWRKYFFPLFIQKKIVDAWHSVISLLTNVSGNLRFINVDELWSPTQGLTKTNW